MKRATKETIERLADVLEWAKGNRGGMDVNPYCVPEIRAALKHLGELVDRDEDLYDVDTERIARGER